MANISQDPVLLQELTRLLRAFRPYFRQERVFQRAVLLLVAEVLTLARHTVTQLLMTLGWVERDWAAWYRLFRRKRFPYVALAGQMVREVVQHLSGEYMVVVGDGSTTPRSSGKMEGVGWLRHPATAPFASGLGWFQRWFHLAWLTPQEDGYSRAIPLLWLPIFTPKSHRQREPARSEVQGALVALRWLRLLLHVLGRGQMRVLMVGDGRYDQLALWRRLPRGVVVMARTARNRVLYSPPTPTMRRHRKYGERAPKPAQVWRLRKGWRKIQLHVRGRDRHLQYQVLGPVLRRGAAHRPLYLIVVRGKANRRVRREPLAFLVNAVQDEQGAWVLPLPVAELLLWVWQRWEIEVAHRELKSAFGLGEKQSWHPEGAVLSVQWSAWVYGVLLLAGYRAYGLTRGPTSPTRWWRGAARWSLNSLWRAYRAAWWGPHRFHPVTLESLLTGGDLNWLQAPPGNATFGAARI